MDPLNSPTLGWLLDGDVSLRYQAYRDLLGEDRPDLRKRIATEGWGLAFLDRRKSDGNWGNAFYSPKWTSTHYTLLDLKNLQVDPDHPQIVDSVNKVLSKPKGHDGGVSLRDPMKNSDVCVNGMVLNYACYFGADKRALSSIVDFILSQKMPDGGFNCNSNSKGAVHSSLHTTLSVIEGITEYRGNGYTYRLADLGAAMQSSVEFILMHQLYRSDRTGKVIRQDFLRFPYPPRWKYDILKCLDAFRDAGVEFDDRMLPALEVLQSKQQPDGRWNNYAPYSGLRHFDMEQSGKPGRWNTLRALRVLKKYNNE